MRTRTARFVGVSAAAAGVCLLATGTANAVPAPDGIPEVVAAAGSDTIYDVTGAIFTAANHDAGNTDPDQFVNVPPVLAAGQTFKVPGDFYDNGTTYDATTNTPPNGSGSGKTALANAAAAGTAAIDVARSSSPRSSSDPATFEYYGFAKDGVSWSASSTGAAAKVSSLTLAQLRGIYSGTITNWNQVGGADAPIKVYLPQAGSGTRAFFTGTVLGFDPLTKPVTVHTFQENEGATIPAADQAAAIAPYSAAQWVAQANGTATDKRGGFFEGDLTGAGTDGVPIVARTGAKWAPNFSDGFLGSRTVYYVLDSRSPSYRAALRYVGFDATGGSPLCSGSLAGTLSDYGFKPLAKNGNGITCTKE
ncbi:substrate-binding domain-containing protein [Amycolatopsis pigmentata]|uniref:Substrate-binding domain-containing protein n=1 Tax=Amycolatopsis pigmentata TaxID=450801 RepID=A0ABW5FMU5_9PSEU